MIAVPNDHIVLSAGNIIAKDKVKKIQERLDRTNNLSIEELQGLIDKMSNGKEDAREGLGLIKMKAWSGNNLNNEFSDVDDDSSFFSLEVTI